MKSLVRWIRRTAARPTEADITDNASVESQPTVESRWDSLYIQRQLVWLATKRISFRAERFLQRLRSPRRLIATSLVLLFFSFYVMNGIFILSARAATDPLHLRFWLSGGMVIYMMYHLVKCVWSNARVDLELSNAETLWLGNSPICRSSLAVYHVGNLLLPAALKTMMLSILLARDVKYPLLLVIGTFTSLMLLEMIRLTFGRLVSGMSTKQRGWFRLITTSTAMALVIQLIACVHSLTPSGSPMWLYVINSLRGLGEIASTPMIQFLSTPWIASAYLTVTESLQPLTVLQLLAALGIFPLSLLMLVKADRWSLRQEQNREVSRLSEGRYDTRESQSQRYSGLRINRLQSAIEYCTPPIARDALNLIYRQAISVRHYRYKIAISLLLPTILCLSPLFMGRITEQWFYVVGGIALCTILLAPPALRIDFRRDLKRMVLLRSLPVKPFSMVVGQLALPILITWTFQLTTLTITALMIHPGWGQFILWTGMLLALAVVTFASENALFLAYPHHQHNEGIAMMLRTKLTFLGKGTVIVITLSLLVLWATLCQNLLPAPYASACYISGSITATWIAAFLGLAAATLCWRRFDIAMDTPPE
ncbi:hypothetical protein OAM37_01675 [bacterium]|nr:hypothetical protein [Pseudomonadales bacterium]MDC0317212.1 hypothetical protein [bacterium]